MRWRSISWTACKGGYRLCLGTLNLLLLCVAGVQLLMIGSVLIIGTITTPQIAQNYLEKRFEREGVQVSWERALFDLTGKVIFEDFVLLDQARENPIFRAEEVRADLDFSPLFWKGPIQLESFFLRQGSLYLPPELSDGSDEPVIRISELKIDHDWDSISIEEAQLRIRETVILTQGKLTLAGYEFARQESFDLSRLWRRMTAQIVPFIAYFERVGDSVVELQFESERASQWSAQADVRIPQLAIEAPAMVELKQVRAQVAFSIVDQQFLLASPQLSTALVSFQSGDTRLTLRDPRLEIFGDYTPLGPHLISPSEFRLMGRVEVPELGVLNLKFEGAVDETFALQHPRLTLHREELRLSLSAELGKADEIRPIHFDFSGDPDAVFNMPALVGGGIGKRTNFSSLTHIGGTVLLEPDNTIQAVTFAVEAKQFSVKEAFFDEANTRGFFKDNLLQVGPIRVFDDDGQQAEGYFIQDFATTGFRIVASGNVKPRRIDSLLPPFYTRLWQDIDPGEKPALADVDVTGKWNDHPSIQAFVDIRAIDAAFRGLPVEQSDVLVWYANGFVELIGLEALTDGLGPRGDIAFTFERPWSKNGNRTFLDVSTVQPLDTLPVIFGSDMEVLAELMQFEQPPLTQIKGFVNDGEEAEISQSIDLKIFSRSAGTFRRVQFDHIQLNLFQENELNFIPLLEGEIDDGRVSLIGEISPASVGQGWAADLWVDTDNLPLETFKDILTQLDPSPTLTLEAPAPSELAGKVDLELEVKFDGVPWETLDGGGFLRIEDANLGRIHLFGGLSKVFSSVGLTMTSLPLDHLQTQVNLAPRKVGLPDLSLRGPALRIDSPGTISLPSTFLDFRAKAYLLDREEPSLQSLIGSILSPLSFFLEVEVKGTFETPIWRLTKNPFNILRSPLRNPINTQSTPEAPNQAKPELPSSVNTPPAAREE